MIGEDAVVENYITKVLGCKLVDYTSTSRVYEICSGVHLRLRYFYPTRADDGMYIGSLCWYDNFQDWKDSGSGKVENLDRKLTNEFICEYVYRRTLDYIYS